MYQNSFYQKPANTFPSGQGKTESNLMEEIKALLPFLL